MKSLTILLFIICLILPANNTQRSNRDNNSIEINLSTDKKIYYMSEPIYFTISILNNTHLPIKSYFKAPPSLIAYRRKGEQDFFKYDPIWVQITLRHCISSSELSPDTSLELKGKLFYDSSLLHHLLVEPGEYEIKVEFNDTDNQNIVYQSKSHIINVLPPPKGESNVLKALNDQDLATFLEGDSRITFCKKVDGQNLIISDNKFQTGAEKAIAFLEQYKNSIYTPIVRKMFIEALEEEFNRSGGKLPVEIQAIYSSMRPINNK